MHKLLLLLSPREATYTTRLDFSRFASYTVRAEQFITFAAMARFCKTKGITAIAVTTYPAYITQSLEGTSEDNLGYIIERDGLRIVLLPSLLRIYQESHMQFLINHYLTKLSNPELFITPPPFHYERLVLADAERWLDKLNSPEALICAVDIETQEEGLLITSIAFTLVTSNMQSYSAAIQLYCENHEEQFLLMRLILATSVPKVMHNGRYDCTYLLRFNAIPTAYLCDTYHMQHCLYPELPKTLAFCSQFYLLGIRYWKEMSGYNKLEYNARDTHSTAWVWVGQHKHIKIAKAQYALRNYLIEFPLVFQCIHVGLEGLAVDEETRLRLREKEVNKLDSNLARLRYILGIPNFNPGSPKQVLNLLHAMGYKVATKSDKKTLQHFAEQGQLELNLVRLIEACRKAAKAISTYYDVKLLNQRLMYSLDPAGTETGRMASKESDFWCGTQIQNIPGYCKPMFVPDDGYLFGSVDGSQAESRCTAYISGDLNLIEAVETSPDFHCTNASLFFGLPFDELFQVAKTMPAYYDEDGTYHEEQIIPAKVLRKDIRTVSKRVNHGANYNMGVGVLWETMGDAEIFKAARLLDLPAYYDATKIAKTLLTCFNRTYPKIKGEWYPRVAEEVLTTGRLVGATGWTRRTFLRPVPNNKPAINACVAHPPQSLSVMVVNKTFLQAWKLQLGKYAGILRLKAQIHDEVFFQYKIGHDYIAEEIGQLYRNNKVVINNRTMVIPNEPKFGATNWGELKD